MLCTKYNFGSERTFETPCILQWRLVVSIQRYFPLTVNCTSLCNKRVQNFLKLLYGRLFFTHIPAYFKLAFTPVVFL